MSDYDTHHMTRVNNDDPFSSTSTSHFVAAANRLLYRLQPRPLPTQDRTQLFTKTDFGATQRHCKCNCGAGSFIVFSVFRAVQTDAQWYQRYSRKLASSAPLKLRPYSAIKIQNQTSLCSAFYGGWNVTLLAFVAGRRPCSNRSRSPSCRAHSSKPTARCCSIW